MHVIHVISGIDAALGGPVAALVGLACAQAADGMQVTVAPVVRSSTLPATAGILKDAGVQVIPLIGSNSPLKQRLSSQRLLRQLLQTGDVVHIYGLWEPIQHRAASICRELGRPYIFEPCGMLDQWALRRSWLKKKLYLALRLRRDLDHAAAIHVSTPWERDQTAGLGLRAPLVVVPAGVDLQEFEQLPPRGLFRAAHPGLMDKPVLMFLGRVFPGKGVEMLIPAVARMTNQDAMLAVVGPDAEGYTSSMKSLAEKLGVQHRVIFTGMARGRERIEALVDADLFCLPSAHENFGVAVLEAMAAGVPVVVSDQVGLWHDIDGARAGEAVPLDENRLATTLDRWLGSDSARREAGQRGRALAFERFTWDLIARQWKQAYTGLAI